MVTKDAKQKKPVRYRKAERPHVELRCRYARVDPAATEVPPFAGLEFAEATLDDLSPQGAFIITDTPLTRGVRIALEVLLPSAWHKVAVLGIVRWARPASDEEPPGMGIEFVNLTSATYVAIGELITALTFRE